MKFNRDYELNILVNNQVITIKPPLRIAFNTIKNNEVTLGKSRLIIYNLKQETREVLRKDADQTKKINVSLKIGYDGKLEKLFSGDIHTCSSVRQGADFVTQVELYDGGYDFFNSYTAKTVTTKKQAITSILEDMPNTTKGKITELLELIRPKVLIGNSYNLISSLISNDEKNYIDNCQLFIVKDTEVISNHEPLVTSSTGLLGTPKRELKKVTFETMLNPTLRLSGKCILQTKFSPELNGLYRIQAINYLGDLEGKDWKQTVEAYLTTAYEVI